VKFWKKQQEGIEFVKVYRAHVGAVDGGWVGGWLGRCRASDGGEVPNMAQTKLLMVEWTGWTS
jgi:hypothetical protein